MTLQTWNKNSKTVHKSERFFFFIFRIVTVYSQILIDLFIILLRREEIVNKSTGICEFFVKKCEFFVKKCEFFVNYE